ncbi:MAG: thioredoxin fold domain-containing protein [Candidatus Diapherotrites archaeon]|nr:thioredoxin fold domain-containing protein [Candidatus Diapherotrites archaeon]
MKVLLFVSSHCPHCPKAEKLAKTMFPSYYDKGLVFKKVRVKTGEGKEFSIKFNVMGTPTFIFLDDDGNYLDRIVGVPSEGRLKGEVEKHLGIKRSFFSKIFG